MKTSHTLNQDDLTAAICDFFKAKGQVVKKVTFNVSATGDCFDRPTGHAVFADVEVESLPLSYPK